MKTKSFIVGVIALLTLSLTIPFETLKADPPRWAPAHGYRARTRQVYFPKQNFYYDTQRSVYIYLDHGRWVTNVHIPAMYAYINLVRAPKIELQINSDYPYRYNRRHVELYRVRDRRDYNQREYYEGDRDGNRRRDDEGDRGNGRGHDREHQNKHDREDD